MKKVIIIFLLFQPILLISQIKDSSNNITFKFTPTDTIDVYNIDWRKVTLKANFELKGQNEMCSIEIINDTTSIISAFKNDKWINIDTLKIDLMIQSSNNIFLPSFKIIDFDKDGYEDIICWVKTNMNRNKWSIIYLYNKNTKSLQKLHNTAEIHWKMISDIWDNPKYNANDSTINCELYSSVYSVSFESKYKLINNIAIPIEKEEEDRTEKKIITNNYIGVNGKWQLIKE